jgi:NAD(P)-dependent dehydrogenase (short-subunit alcohol dehydrogenase family)
MTRGILIAGNESSLCRAIEAETAGRVAHYAIALIPNRLSGPVRPSAGGDPSARQPEKMARFPLEWNPGSPISARTLALAAENRLEHIDEAILICSPPSIRRAAAELSLADIEIMINDHVKGWFFLARELSAVFRSRQSGTLALVYDDAVGSSGGANGGKDDAADLLGPSALALFRAFTHSLLAAAFSEPYLTVGFSGSGAGNDTGFASFVFRLLDEGSRRNNGKLHKYGKFNFLK